MESVGGRLAFTRGERTAPTFAFIGVRACELQAIAVQDRVFLGDEHADPSYRARREGAFVVAVNCGQAGGTCFCASMGAGPKVCGPEVMMRFVVRDLLDCGMDPARVHVSMERNMKCAVGHCGRCQFGPAFVCNDGPVLSFDRIADLIGRPEI